MNQRDSLMRKFRKSRKETDHEVFKRQRNRVNILVRKAKSQYHQNHLNEAVNDPNKFWKKLKSIFPVKTKQKFSKYFLVDDVITNDSKTIANGFCSYFTNIAAKIKSKAILLKNFIWTQPSKRLPKTYNSFRLKPVTTTVVYKMLRKLKKKKSKWPR